MLVIFPVIMLFVIGGLLCLLGIYSIVKGTVSGPGKVKVFSVNVDLPPSVIILLVGVLCIGGGAYLGIVAQSKIPAASPLPTATVASTEGVSPSTQPADSQNTTAGPTEIVSVTSPESGTAVGGCSIFKGTSSLRAGRTLVLAERNLSDPMRILYLEAVTDYDTPAALKDWSGEVFFGSGDSSVGQTYEVQVIIIDVSVVRAALAIPANNPSWHTTSLPQSSIIENVLRVKRIKGPGTCG
jgi:hypothetical protein